MLSDNTTKTIEHKTRRNEDVKVNHTITTKRNDEHLKREEDLEGHMGLFYWNRTKNNKESDLILWEKIM